MNYFYIFILGILSILGPCTFIMIPTIINKIKSSFIQTLYFFFGILLIFILLGITASITGIIFTNNINRYLYFLAGIVSLFSGFNMLGAIKIEYPSIKKINQNTHTFFEGLLHGGVMIGCIGPQLSAALTFIIAQRNFVSGIFMIIFYTLGFILPFFVFGIIITDQSIQVKMMQYVAYLQKIGGFLMLGVSIYLLYFSFQGFI